MTGGEACLELHAAEVGPDKVEFIAGAQVSGTELASQQIDIQDYRNLEARKSLAIDVSDPSHKIDPMSGPSQTDARTKSDAWRYPAAGAEETVHARIDPGTEELVVLPHHREGDQNGGQQYDYLFHEHIHQHPKVRKKRTIRFQFSTLCCIFVV